MILYYTIFITWRHAMRHAMRAFLYMITVFLYEKNMKFDINK